MTRNRDIDICLIVANHFWPKSAFTSQSLVNHQDSEKVPQIFLSMVFTGSRSLMIEPPIDGEFEKLQKYASSLNLRCPRTEPS